MNLTIIQKSIDYIEDNLKTDITVKELSELAGFSVYHYYRLFQSAVGMPVMQQRQFYLKVLKRVIQKK